MQKKPENIMEWLFEDVHLRKEKTDTVMEQKPKSSGLVEKRVSDLKRLLSCVDSHPIMCCTDLYEHARMSRNGGNRTKQDALRLKLAVEETVQIQQGKGKTITTIGLTEKGYQFLGIQMPKGGKGGILHRMIQRAIYIMLKILHLNPVIEFNLAGKLADIGFQLKNQLWAVEVVDNTARFEDSNLIKDFSAGFDHIVFIPKDAKTRSILEKTLSKAVDETTREKAHIYYIEDFYSFIEEQIEDD